ncbi:MAG TPA: hypothetical protein VMU04_12395 [Candidatus Acidoferrum sp.]|nr:hypothetical protein [Candidatus Acidoferrum sp.]
MARLLLFQVAIAISGLSSVAGQSAVDCPPKVPLVIGGFDPARSGNYSFPGGAYFSEARTAILTNFPQTSFASIEMLTLDVLSNIDVLIIGSPSDNTAAAAPLALAEQTNLLNFIERGGSAVILTDNSTFSPSAPAANESYLDPFGMDADGTDYGIVSATVLNPTNHPVTDGAFGLVSSFAQGYPGAITNLGPFGTALATNNLGVALAVIEANTISAGSGRVVFGSDINMFDLTYYSANLPLFLNTIDYCRRSLCTPLRIDFIPPFASNQFPLRVTGAPGTNYIVQVATNLASPGASWINLITNKSLTGTFDFVDVQATNPVRFYRAMRQ